MTDQKLILTEWVKDKLSDILCFQIPDEMAEMMIFNENEKDLDANLKNLLDFKDARTRKFVAELMKRRQTVNMEPVSRTKTDTIDKYVMKNSKNAVEKENDINFEALTKKTNAAPEKQPKGSSNTKKKNKYVNLYSKDGEPTLRKGRYVCNCEAKKHELINNCLKCGRIVCKQEGSGPCFFCGTLVCTPEELMVFNGDTSKASKLYEQLLMLEKPKMQKGLEDAINQRNKLLEFDKNTKKHTHVFDDDSDYFCSVNPWLTLEEREKCKKLEEEFFNKKNQSRLDKKILLKIDGLKVTEEEEKTPTFRITEKDLINKKNEQYSPINKKLDSIDHLLDPYFSDIRPQFKGTMRKQTHEDSKHFTDSTLTHIMDKELHQMKDEGYCISIHQPWASFLVNNIRNVEGRTWYTSYRGKLWIASTGVKLSRQDAMKYENTYRSIKGDIKFPADYPSGCLLGCVDLVDCLTQEQYRAEYPDGELEDPYVFICENCQPLPVRYPMKGKPNIYKLDEKVHTAAKLCLRTMEKVLSESDTKVKSIRP